MLTETLSGKCPCCGYDKLLQRYGSSGYYQLDGCAKCGFGYGSNHHDDESDVGPSAWLSYGIHLVALNMADVKVKRPKIFDDIMKESGSISSDHPEYKKHQEEFDTVYYKIRKDLELLNEEEQRQEVFEWAESINRADDLDTTVFNYTQEDVENYKLKNNIIL